MNAASGQPLTLQPVGDAEAAFCDPESDETCALPTTASIQK